MSYSKTTPNYDIPYISDNEIMSGTDEETANLIIDNQLRAGILGAGGTRVYQNGTFTATIVDVPTGRVEVTLTGIDSNPSAQGIANNCLVEIFDSIVWQDLAANSFYYLYLQATPATFVDATNVNIISSESPITSLDYLFLATVDTTNTDATPTPTQPVVDSSPPGKPTAFNIFQLLNNNHDPFGESLTQTILTVLSQFTCILDKGTTALFQQLNPDATLPVITIENVSGQPEISSSGLLRFADSFIPQGFAFSDEANTAYQGVAVSIIGALNEILTELLTHINNNQDPHGEILYQTSLVLANFLEVPQLRINPPTLPPSPPLSPPPPAYFDIISSGELRLGDIRGGIALTDPANSVYHGTAISLLGALNELLGLINNLSDVVGGLVGTTVPALSPVVFEVAPEELGLTLNFKLLISEAEDFTNIIATKETLTSVTGWWYEYHPPAPPVPPSPPLTPYTLPGAILVPDPPPDPVWVPLPVGGLVSSLQVQDDGRPTRVKYEPQSGDGLFLRHRYTVGIQEYNGQYGEMELGAYYFG